MESKTNEDPQPDRPGHRPPRVTRRRALLLGAGGVAGIVGLGALGFELVDQGVLPGKLKLDEILGDCAVPAPKLTIVSPGPSHSGTFFSRARNQTVGYTVAYPPGHGRGSELPLGIALHGFGGNHNMKMGGLTLAQALAARYRGVPLAPMALVAVDGGGLYWNAHPGDDPMAMIVNELIPMCQKVGLGKSHKIGAVGISMGGYGSLLLAEKNPQLISAAAAVSPAIWTSYPQARAANAGAYASAADFHSDDVITHASALRGTPVRIASGIDDPFHPGAVAISKVAPDSVTIFFGPGCHAGSFFTQQQHPSLGFLGRHLTSA